ncbi:hypothetical protein M9H77_14389 [Catharanthus roseus]|uniref:Uncharacterized protein n=1 Tax=Catharanthus roseus TaxID=4058 RepID=A0ACC0BN27_CATRO|nr:hypothetical protein M9H77_14389 [Catharanthus roseus]
MEDSLRGAEGRGVTALPGLIPTTSRSDPELPFLHHYAPPQSLPQYLHQYPPWFDLLNSKQSRWENINRSQFINEMVHRMCINKQDLSSQVINNRKRRNLNLLWPFLSLLSFLNLPYGLDALPIEQRFFAMSHPQLNELAKVTNRTILHMLKKQLMQREMGGQVPSLQREKFDPEIKEQKLYKRSLKDVPHRSKRSLKPTRINEDEVINMDALKTKFS